jgi:hypothetical protein
LAPALNVIPTYLLAEFNLHVMFESTDKKVTYKLLRGMQRVRAILCLKQAKYAVSASLGDANTFMFIDSEKRIIPENLIAFSSTIPKKSGV